MAYTDVTQEFNQLCGLLAKGEMVQAPGFDLSKAISAVELFSTKMDASMIPKRPQPDSLNLRVEDLTDEEIVGIIDRVWNLEAAYYEGSPLAQSIMTCLYCHPSVLEKVKEKNEVLYALLAASLRLSFRAHELIVATGVCFEEDFYSGSMGVENPGRSLDDATVSELLVQAATKVSDSRLVSRLMARSALIEASKAMDAFNFEAAEKYLMQYLNELPRIKFEGTEKSLGKTDFAFDPTVNFALMAPQPPRPEVKYVAAHVFVKWHNMVENFLLICHARKSVSSGSLRGELLSLYEELCRFSRMKRSVNSFARARMALALCDTQKRAFGLAPWPTLIAKDVALWGSDATSSYMEDLGSSHTALQLMFQMFSVLCMNPARQRRRLVHRLEELGSFQQRCESVDAKRMKIPSFEEMETQQKQKLRESYVMPLGAWAGEWCVRLMIRFLELGSELELYRPREAKSLVYYLYFIHRLSVDFHSASLRARHVTAEWEVSPKHPFVNSLRRQMAFNELKRIVCLGNLQLIAALNAYEHGETADAKAVFDHPRMHFEHRFFDPFSTVWLPQTMSYADVFTAFRPNQSISVGVMIERCEESYKVAKSLVPDLIKRPEFVAEPRAAEELKDLLRSLIKNSLAGAGLKAAFKNKEKMKYSAEFDPFGYASLMTVKLIKDLPSSSS